jgi:nucleoside-diphosphate-sugar epimerase
VELLVTGATGFIGRHLVSALLTRGHVVTAVARCEGAARNMPWIAQVQFLAADVQTPLSFLQIKAFAAHDALIHLAWPGLPNYKAKFHIEQNLPANIRFIGDLVDAGLPRVMVTGTCFEYGMQSGCLIETMETQPTNAYALAKDGLRKQLQDLQHSKPFELLWTRLFYMHGTGQNPNSLLAQLDHAIAAGEPEFRMSGGEQLRDYLPVSDVAERLALLLDCPIAQGVFNICSGKPMSVRSLVEQHIERRGSHIRPVLGYYPYPDYEPMAFWGSNQKFEDWIFQ